MPKLKVFSGSSTDVKGGLTVGAYSRADAVRQLQSLGYRDVSDYYIKGWWLLTHNKLQLQVATERGVWRELVVWPKTIKDFERIA